MTEEPPVDDAASLPGPDTGAELEGVEVGDPAATLVGGTSFAGAAPIDPGTTYAADVLPGEVLVYRVPVQWGQRLEAVADFPEPDGDLAEHLRTSLHPVDLKIFGPDRGEVTEPDDTAGTDSRVALSWQEARRATATTAQVRYWNRLEGVLGGAADRAGDYYVVVALTSDQEEDAVAQPFTLTTRLVGEPHDGPTYLDLAPEDGAFSTAGAQPQDDPAATQRPGDTGGGNDGAEGTGADPGDDATTAASDQDQDGGSGWLPWALGAGALLAAGAGVVVLVRRRGTTG